MEIREFWEWYWNRNSDNGKYDIEGFINPLVLDKFYEYMHHHRFLENWEMRNSDNWQKWFWEEHYEVCMKSLLRHVHDLWMEHRGYKSREWVHSALMGSLFNLMAYAKKYYEEDYDLSERREELNSKDSVKEW